MTSVTEREEGRYACTQSLLESSLHVNEPCCDYLAVYSVAFGALTGNTQSVFHQFKSQYLLLDVLL